MEHYFSKKQESPLNIKKIRQRIKGIEFEFYTASGIFSKERIDKGTLVLAESMIIGKKCYVLDIGCGIGVLGIAAAKLFDTNAVMSDVNERAVMLARKNAELNNVKAEVYQGNLYEKIKKNDFDVVLSNPPQTAGKEICFQLIVQSKNYLKSYRSEASGELKNQRFLSNNGSLQLVARHNKGGGTLSKKMEEVFGNVKVIEKKAGYWVYMSEKK